jgi:hypothetical protein
MQQSTIWLENGDSLLQLASKMHVDDELIEGKAKRMKKIDEEC